MNTPIINRFNFLNQSYTIASAIIVNYISAWCDGNDHTSLYVSLAYKHLQGLYQAGDEDIIIRSLDDNEDFKLELGSLVDRPLTRQALWGDLGKEVEEKYPLLILLFRGIRSPITVGLKLKDGEFMPQHIPGVESQEITLMNELQDIAYNIRSKHDLNAYIITDDYFHHAYLATLHLALMVHILNLRIDRVNTPEAHSFHVSQKLNSNDIELDDIVLITETMRRWLYKNIQHVHGTIGSNKSFNYLLDGVLRYTDYVVNGYIPRIQLTDNTPGIKPVFENIPYVNGDKDIFTFDQYIQSRETVREDATLDALVRMRSGDVGYTKNLLVDGNLLPNGSAVSFNDFIIYMLLYNISLGAYEATVKVNISGGKHIIISSEIATALIFSEYMLYNNLNGSIPCNIQVPIVYVRSPLSHEYLTDIRQRLTAIGNVQHEELDVLILAVKEVPKMRTNSEFLRWCIERYETLSYLTLFVNSIPDAKTRTIIQAVLYDMYPPRDDITLSTAGYSREDMLKIESELTRPDVESIFETLTLTRVNEQFGPWLTSTVNTLNNLTTYSTAFDISNLDLHIDMDISTVEVLDVTVI